VPGTPAPKKGAPIGLIVTAIVVVVALIGAAVWFFKLRGTDDAGTTTATNVPSIPGNNLSAPGSIIGWGENDFYQITTGVSSDEAVGPTAIPGTDDAVRIAAGSAANYFIKADGTLWGWGGYVASQNATAKTPIQIGSWTNVADVAAFKDSDTILVLLTDGSVYAMGDNEYGEVGTGSPTNSAIYTPNKVGVTNVIAVAAGGSTGYALDSSGAVWAWGENTYGQLGVGNTRESFAVAQVSGLPQIAAIGAGRKSGYAIDTTGALWGWGSNGSGQLGLGNNSDQATPVKTEINNAVFVDCGDDTAYVIRSDGSLWATGHGTYGELGNGIRKNSNVFVPSLITHCIHVSQLWGSTAAIDGSGNVYVFGNNWDGRLGIGSTEDDIAEPTKNGVTGATQVAAGWWHLIALTVK
jgi:alpha-tubulin suppressor-like RCC1 family protein